MPRASDKPQMGTQSNKNFVTTNATTSIMSGLLFLSRIYFATYTLYIVPKKPVAHYVDTCKGDKQQLEQSGLTPVYVNKAVCTLYIIARQVYTV